MAKISNFKRGMFSKNAGKTLNEATEYGFKSFTSASSDFAKGTQSAGRTRSRMGVKVSSPQSSNRSKMGAKKASNDGFSGFDSPGAAFDESGFAEGVGGAGKYRLNRNNTSNGSYRNAAKSGIEKLGFSREAADELRNIGAAGKNFAANINQSGGWKSLAGQAGRGAIAGGLTGASVGALTGEDPWESAKKGSMLGAAGYGGVTALKRGVGASSTKGLGQSISQFNQNTGVSKSVKRLAELQKDAITSRKANKLNK